MFALTVALVVTTVLSFSFASTRRIGLLSIALLAFLFAELAAVLRTTSSRIALTRALRSSGDWLMGRVGPLQC